MNTVTSKKPPAATRCTGPNAQETTGTPDTPSTTTKPMLSKSMYYTAPDISDIVTDCADPTSTHATASSSSETQISSSEKDLKLQNQPSYYLLPQKDHLPRIPQLKMNRRPYQNKYPLHTGPRALFDPNKSPLVLNTRNDNQDFVLGHNVLLLTEN